MKARYALPVVIAASFGIASSASAQGAGAFSYQKQWWPQAAATFNGRPLASGEAYAYAGPSGPDLWNDPRAWWPDYNVAAPQLYVPARRHR